MERCQEISHWMPTMAQVTAATEAQTCQGMLLVTVRDRLTGCGENVDVAAIELPSVLEIIRDYRARSELITRAGYRRRGRSGHAGGPLTQLRAFQQTSTPIRADYKQNREPDRE